jgi:hypothetical protein
MTVAAVLRPVPNDAHRHRPSQRSETEGGPDHRVAPGGLRRPQRVIENCEVENTIIPMTAGKERAGWHIDFDLKAADVVYCLRRYMTIVLAWAKSHAHGRCYRYIACSLMAESSAKNPYEHWINLD